MRLAFVALATVLMLTAKISLAATLVVQPVKVVECTAVPEEIAGSAEAVIELPEVGIAVPVATFQTSNVIVPVSTVMFQAEIVHAKGTVKYVVCVAPELSADPDPSKPAPIARILTFEGICAAVAVPEISVKAGCVCPSTPVDWL